MLIIRITIITLFKMCVYIYIDTYLLFISQKKKKSVNIYWHCKPVMTKRSNTNNPKVYHYYLSLSLSLSPSQWATWISCVWYHHCDRTLFYRRLSTTREWKVSINHSIKDYYESYVLSFISVRTFPLITTKRSMLYVFGSDILCLID